MPDAIRSLILQLDEDIREQILKPHEKHLRDNISELANALFNVLNTLKMALGYLTMDIPLEEILAGPQTYQKTILENILNAIDVIENIKIEGRGK